MFSYSMNDPQKKITVDSDMQMNASHAMMSELLTTIDIFHVAAPMSTLLWERTSPTPSPVYNHRINLVDGRHWIQTVTFTSGQPEPTQTINAVDQWKISEISLIRKFREIFTSYTIPLGISKLKVTFL